MPKKTPISPVPFVAHLNTVRVARECTDEAVAILDSNRDHANRAIDLTWQFLFDHLCRKSGEEKPVVSELHDYSSVIYRLVQSMYKLGALDKLSQAKQRQHILAMATHAGLPPDLRADLERELNLIG